MTLRRVLSLALMLGATATSAHAQQATQEETARQATSFELVPRAFIQLDWRGYPDWTVAPGTGRLDLDTFQVRRLRGGVDGRWRRVAFELTLDPQDVDGTLVKDAYAELRAGEYRIRAGQFKPPGSREYSTAARNIDLLERAALARSLAAHRDIGVMVHGDLGTRVDYDVGLFAGDDNGSNRRSGLTGAGRLEWEPGIDLIVGVFGSEGRVMAVDEEPENGISGRLPSGYRFFEDVYVRGTRRRIGGDVEWSPGRWQFTVEALRVRDEREGQGVDFDDLPSVVGVGASATARWRFAPRREVVARYEYLGFDDVGPATALAGVRPRAADLRARSGQTVTLGGSWRAVAWARLMANAGAEWFSEPRSAPEPGRRGVYWTFGTRLQVELPAALGFGR
ncbi:MAG: hypothetical protein A3I61_05355 [Acidobacteria bacterium RIFCSPLOWO2_02_FULL_68_18]|nr:MAG: hypothetical protein A3I61_05355 [Acidobacteria bacterium RIFCSPLOWO2_02_FULL_68_18]OFW49269.1 MAG: hypothetical protein A3G77_04155 [Acidobacteria bacterium RIFCSPLOWO2_12_FULL_68_19]